MKTWLCFGFMVLSNLLQAQQKTKNVIVVTLDGMRWEEVFKGADPVLINDSTFTPDRKDLRAKFWADTEAERRRKLFPFFWSTIATQGQLYGNRAFDNKVNNANPYWFSYPGYNEIFTGYPDTAMNTNDKVPNPNENVFEFLIKRPEFKDRAAVFSSWDVFSAIFNEPRSKVPVSAGFQQVENVSPGMQLLNDMQMHAAKTVGDDVRPDMLTYYIAREYMKAKKPRLLYIAFDETDDYAHAGKYDFYLNTARNEDEWIGELWKYVQSTPEYKDQTTMIILTDHGRGDKVKSNWQHHGQKIEDACQIWMAVIGPDTNPLGEVKTPMQLYQKQVAATVAKLLGYDFKPNHPVGDPVSSIYSK